MDKSEVRIFIIDDDQTIGKALKEVVKNLGFNGIVCTNPTDGLAQFRMQGGQLVITDCLLPKMSGIELAKQLRKEFGSNLPIVLTSGVFKDKTFIKDALQQTDAVGFFVKPFQIKELQEKILGLLEGKYEDNALPLENLLTKPSSPAERIQEINNVSHLDAYEIPWLCCLLMSSSATGILRFQSEKEKAAISFFQGRITQVEMQSPESFFGALLIEKGFVSAQNIEDALKIKNSKRLGEKLVDMNLLSPHIISSINAEQTAIRLSKIITDANYSVTFVEENVADLGASINTETIAPFLIDWLNSKIPTTWLKQRYLKWVNSPCVLSQNIQSYQRLWNTPPLKNVPNLVSSFGKGATLSQILAQGQYKEETVYQIFHLLIIIGYILIKREVKAIDEMAQIARLRKILQDMKTQDYFAILGVGRNMKAPDLKKTYYELAKVFHPDRLPANATKTLKELAQEVFSQMTSAYETLSDDTRRTIYIKELELGRAEKILKAESLIDEGKSLLKSGQAPKARDKFEEAVKLRPPSSDLWIHLAWAKMMGGGGKQEDRLLEVETMLTKIPPEDRHNAIFYFVKGLYQKMTGEEAAAKKNLQNALILNPKFIDAERLLRSFELNKKKVNTDIFRGDLKDVVGNLFRKK